MRVLDNGRSVEDTIEGDIEEDEETVAVNYSDEIAITETNFPDAFFRLYLESFCYGMRYDEVTAINVSGLRISSLKGIELFPNLQYLHCSACNVTSDKLTSLDISKNVNLLELDCSYNSLTTLDVSKNVNLQKLDCSDNSLTSLDTSRNANLEVLKCSYNSLSSLDVSKNVSLKTLRCSGNNIKEVNLNTNSCIGENMYNAIYEFEESGVVAIDVATTLSIPNARNIASSDSSVAKVSGSKIIPQKTGEYYKDCTITYTLNGKTVSYPLYIYDASPEGIDPSEPITNPSYNIEVATKDNLQASITCSYSDMSMLEYSFYATKTPDDPNSYEIIRDWNSSNKLNWTPSIYGDYTICGRMRVAGYPDTEVGVIFEYAYHPCIKGNCQMPYAMIAPGEPGYLIGLETYAGTVASVEMLILDCSSMQWTYSTGKNLVPENMLWTVWQPQYGYYWTLFRAYDKSGRLIDEVCYGFVNAY